MDKRFLMFVIAYDYFKQQFNLFASLVNLSIYNIVSGSFRGHRHREFCVIMTLWIMCCDIT